MMAIHKQRSDSMQPLAGTKLVSVAFNLPGPAAVARLCEWGATVTKVEPPGGDPLKHHCPDLYQRLVADQRVVELDLKSSHGRQDLERFLAEADVLVTSTLPASLARLGLAWDELHARCPRLCQVAILGHAPPREEITGHDLTYQAVAGLLSPPAMPRTLWADIAGSQAAVAHALAVLAERARTGQGQLSYVAIEAALEPYTWPVRYGLTIPGARLAGALPNYNIYPTREGWLAVAALEPHFFKRLTELLSARDSTYEGMKRVFAARTALEWQAWGEQNRLPLAAIVEPALPDSGAG
jgi:alpha-methylacyl-CoA racemase